MKNYINIFIFILIIVFVTVMAQKVSNAENAEFTNNSGEVSQYPILNTNAVEPQIEAESAISVIYNTVTKDEKLLWSKNSKKQFPIASITKLVTAYVAIEENGMKNIDDYLYPMLIESKNKSAEDLAGLNNKKIFIQKMNDFAKSVDANNTVFNNPSGLDYPKTNLSTVEDLVKIAQNIYDQKPIILEISNNKEIEYNGTTLKNTNNINAQSIPFSMIGGKTGETPKAKQALLLVTKSPIRNSIIVSVILSSTNRDKDMEILLNWINKSYEWRK